MLPLQASLAASWALRPSSACRSAGSAGYSNGRIPALLSPALLRKGARTEPVPGRMTQEALRYGLRELWILITPAVPGAAAPLPTRRQKCTLGSVVNEVSSLRK